MQSQKLTQLLEFLNIVTQIDRTIYFRCRKAQDMEALARGLATLLHGTVRTFLHSGKPLLPEDEDRMVEPLLAGETVIFIYPGEARFPVEFASNWDSYRFDSSQDGKNPGFLVVVQVFDDDESVPYEGSTRWIFEEEVEDIEKIGMELTGPVIRLGV